VGAVVSEGSLFEPLVHGQATQDSLNCLLCSKPTRLVPPPVCLAILLLVNYKRQFSKARNVHGMFQGSTCATDVNYKRHFQK
jgi:hypothetical protein